MLQQEGNADDEGLVSTIYTFLQARDPGRECMGREASWRTGAEATTGYSWRLCTQVLLTAIAVEMALSTSSCASFRFCITNCFYTHQPFHMSVQWPQIHIHGRSLRMLLMLEEIAVRGLGINQRNLTSMPPKLRAKKLAIFGRLILGFDKLSFSNAQTTQESLDKSPVHTFLSFLHKHFWIFAMNKWAQPCAQAISARTWMVPPDVANSGEDAVRAMGRNQ